MLKVLAQLIYICTWQKIECKNKTECKICQAANKSGLYTSFLSRQAKLQLSFFFEIKHQETTYTVRSFCIFFPLSTTEMNSASAQYPKLQLKPLKTAHVQHSLEADLLKNHSQKLHAFLPAFIKLIPPASPCHHTSAPYRCYFSCSVSQVLALSFFQNESVFLLLRH